MSTIQKIESVMKEIADKIDVDAHHVMTAIHSFLIGMKTTAEDNADEVKADVLSACENTEEHEKSLISKDTEKINQNIQEEVK